MSVYIFNDVDTDDNPVEYKIKNSPERINLCLGESWDFEEETDFEDLNEVTWASDDPVSLVIGYIRDDIYKTKILSLIEKLEAIAQPYFENLIEAQDLEESVGLDDDERKIKESVEKRLRLLRKIISLVKEEL